MKLLAFLLYGSLQAVRYKDCGTTGMKINDIKGTGYIIKSNASQKDKLYRGDHFGVHF